MKIEHYCKPATMCQLEYEKYFSQFDIPGQKIGAHGDAIGDIFIDTELKIAYCHNSEYATIIKFCPFCGESLIQPPKNLKS